MAQTPKHWFAVFVRLCHSLGSMCMAKTWWRQFICCGSPWPSRQWLQPEEDWLSFTSSGGSHSTLHQQKRCFDYPTCWQMDEHHIYGLHPWSIGCHHMWSCTSNVNANNISQHGVMIQSTRGEKWLIVSHLWTKIPKNFNYPITMQCCHAFHNAVSATGRHEPLVKSMLFILTCQHCTPPRTTTEKWTQQHPWMQMGVKVRVCATKEVPGWGLHP